MQGNDDVVYRLNERDEVCFVNSAYDAFAEENWGAHVASHVILHRSLWDFIGDSTTQQLYREAIRRARAGRRVKFRFRCDSPTCRRLMEVEIAREATGVVEFRIRAVTQEPRPRQALLDAQAKHTHQLLRVCGWCKKVHVGDAWLEVEDAVDRLRLFEQSSLPGVSHGICDRCYQAALARLQDGDEDPQR